VRRPRGARPKSNARSVAALVLAAVERGEARSGDTLSREMNRGDLSDPRDRGLATELVYGSLRWQRQLDHALRPWVKQGLGKLEPMARAFLRIGAYQILHLDRIPAPIAVSATQDAARAAGMARVTGLINGVLRRVTEAGFTAPEGQTNAAIAMRWSLPTWIVGSLRTAYGDHAVEAEAEALKSRAPNTVRPTLTRGGFDALRDAWKDTPFKLDDGPHGTGIVTGPGDPFATDAFHAGLFVPQDPASLHIVDLVEVTDGMRVLDLCAGRGIKATALADRGAKVVAVDLEQRKLDGCNALAQSLGLTEHITTQVADGVDPNLNLGTFDCVLVDAPCTGLGTLRRHPEIAWRRRPDDVGRLGILQRELLATGARHVAPGGRLIYAVCTFGAEEGPPSSVDGFTEVSSIMSRPSDNIDAFQATVWQRDL
jgi:16S rRNA (cytosine967-C5)-methyltransferase